MARRPTRHLPAVVVLAVGLVLDLVRIGPAAALLGLVGGLAVVVLLTRWGVWSWLAALAAVTVVLGPLRALDAPYALRQPSLVLFVALALLVLAWQASRGLLVAGGVLLAGVTVMSAAWSTYGGSGPGPLLWVPLLAGALLATAAALGAGRAEASRMRPLCTVTVLVPVLATLGEVATGGGTGTGAALAVSLWPAAGALGLTALLRGRRGRATARPQSDEHDAAALADFRERYQDPTLAPVALVIAAYNEAAGLPAVLDDLPEEVAGLGVDVLVVDDGSADGTADAVRAHPRARLVTPGVNRGQGAALRLGYRVAREQGATYVVTTDADGQYDPDDIATVLAPVLAGTADFVTGSRRLGGQETRDRVRRLGVHVFAWTTSALTGHWCTDTSFGLRAMRAEVTRDVTLNQPQYQSSELMIGALSHGYRVREVPARMRVRTAGASKKGGNLVYGSRYARVVLGTWWREGAPAPVGDRAAALTGHRDPSTPRGGRA